MTPKISDEEKVFIIREVSNLKDQAKVWGEKHRVYSDTIWGYIMQDLVSPLVQDAPIFVNPRAAGYRFLKDQGFLEKFRYIFYKGEPLNPPTLLPVSKGGML